MDMQAPPSPDVQEPIESFLKREMRLLGLMFDDIALTKLRRRRGTHPAVARYDLMERFLDKKEPIRYPTESPVVTAIGSIALDCLCWERTPEDLVGGLDPEVLRQLRRRVNDPSQFDDQMAAFCCWSMLAANGLTAELVEKDGLPDILVHTQEGESQWLEVKRIRLGKKPAGIRKLIGRANAQIKRSNAVVGSVYLHLERPAHRVVLDDRIPHSVQGYIDIVARELRSGHSRRVADVIVAWDDYMVLGYPPDVTAYFFRRRSTVLRHRSSHSASLVPTDALALGRTVMLPIKWRGQQSTPVRTPPMKVGDCTVTELFRKECEVPGYVRAVHAIEALLNPDAIEKYQLGEIAVLLAIRRISLGRHPYTLLVIAAERSGSQSEVYLGFRLYDEPDRTPQTELRPFMAFEELLKRYAVPITVGEQFGMFIPATRIGPPRTDVQPLVQAHVQKGESVLVNAFVMRDVEGFANVAWAFAISTGRYAVDVRHWQR